jgi:hypothetical protein
MDYTVFSTKEVEEFLKKRVLFCTHSIYLKLDIILEKKKKNLWKKIKLLLCQGIFTSRTTTKPGINYLYACYK